MTQTQRDVEARPVPQYEPALEQSPRPVDRGPEWSVYFGGEELPAE